MKPGSDFLACKQPLRDEVFIASGTWTATAPMSQPTEEGQRCSCGPYIRWWPVGRSTSWVPLVRRSPADPGPEREVGPAQSVEYGRLPVGKLDA